MSGWICNQTKSNPVTVTRHPHVWCDLSIINDWLECNPIVCSVHEMYDSGIFVWHKHKHNNKKYMYSHLYLPLNQTIRLTGDEY